MVATNYTNARNHLKSYCDMATDNGEIVIVTRKEDRDVVMMSLEQYNELLKELNNTVYLQKLDRGFQQLYSGKGTEHELIED